MRPVWVLLFASHRFWADDDGCFFGDVFQDVAVAVFRPNKRSAHDIQRSSHRGSFIGPAKTRAGFKHKARLGGYVSEQESIANGPILMVPNGPKGLYSLLVWLK